MLPLWLPPPSLCQSTVYTDSVWLGGGVGGSIESCWRPYSTGILHSVYDQIHNLQNSYTPPRKYLGGKGGLREINTCRKVPIQVTVLDDDISLLSIIPIFLWANTVVLDWTLLLVTCSKEYGAARVIITFFSESCLNIVYFNGHKNTVFFAFVRLLVKMLSMKKKKIKMGPVLPVLVFSVLWLAVGFHPFHIFMYRPETRGVPRGDAQDARASPLPPCAFPPRPCASPPPAWKAGYEKRW
jgi:hypothetical protein